MKNEMYEDDEDEDEDEDEEEETEDDENYEEELAEYVAEVLKRAPLAIGVLKRLVREGLDLPLFDALNLEIELTAPLIETADGREGVGAFIEKRPADFKGR